MKSSFSIQLQGYAAANRDATVRLVNQATGTVVERSPFLDGSLLVRDLDPGPYEVEVRHPNLIQPIDRRLIRLFPQPTPTRITIPVPQELFRDTPIRDIPDADLAPVQQVAADVRRRLEPVGGKSPGEAIRAADWNVMVAAVSDLAGAIGELTQLVAPKGHDHPEIAEKIDEVQGNLRRFAEAFGKSLLEIRRELETANLDKTVNDVLDLGGATPAIRDRLRGRVQDLKDAVRADPSVFTGKLAIASNLILTEVQQMAVSQGDNADTFLSQESVKQLTTKAQQFSQAGTQIRADSELQVYQRAGAASGATLFNFQGLRG
ncbi:hypothetical protein [Nodosilinea sp. E11]|uniref:hypothetical protein n=1 Tax=Nodosilinea sp. E11 TaxID=3037479 RepID=UPI002934194D|nr:hypothetical protein [Nodosilinea sp. E11]WOD39725.1 hypothetical protein RRF56_02810 [Nodosilinea sp. E11]